MSRAGSNESVLSIANDASKVAAEREEALGAWKKMAKPREGWCTSGELVRMARELGVVEPEAGPWVQMLCQVVEQLPFAVCITDMRVPGLPITACNTAMTSLTGYSKSDICGRNCRFLQGAKTEAAAVREMVVAIRTGKKTAVRVMNYKRDGSTFLNSVMLSPVHDETGAYRFSIGVLSDAESYGDGPALAALCAALPKTMQAASQPPAFDPSLSEVTDEAANKQYRSAVVAFTRLQWSTSWEKALMDVVAHGHGLIDYSAWLQREAPEDVAQLELIAKALPVVDQPISEAGPQALEICHEYLGASLKEGWAAVAMLKNQLQQALSNLSSGSFLSFMQSKASLSLIDKMVGDSSETMVPRSDLLWSGYTVPKDCAGWLHAFTSVAEHHPACIVLSDMAMSGNPMVFVNRAFCRVTEYAKHEASGRNCRFLQGPQTEPESVAVIQDTLRRGVDCHVRITNYRKSGELFENLLTMRPVHDSNAVYRYSIGVQYEVSRTRSLEAQVADLESLLALLPLTVEVSSQAVGLSHRRALNQEEKSADLWVKLERAMAKDIVRPAILHTWLRFFAFPCSSLPCASLDLGVGFDSLLLSGPLGCFSSRSRWKAARKPRARTQRRDQPRPAQH